MNGLRLLELRNDFNYREQQENFANDKTFSRTNPGHPENFDVFPGLSRNFQDKKHFPGLSRNFQDCGHPESSQPQLSKIISPIIIRINKFHNVTNAR